MARKKLISSEELQKKLDEYILEHSGAVPTIPQFGEYLRKNNIPIQDHTLRRDKKFREYLDAAYQKTSAASVNELVTYHSLDIPAFLTKNNSLPKLKEALAVRDQYYAGIARKGAAAIAEKKKLESKNSKLQKEIDCLKKELVEAKKISNRKELHEKEKALTTIKQLMNSYIYPDMANAILKKDGILEIVNSVIPDELAESMTINATTDISALEGESISSSSQISLSTETKSEESSTGISSVDKLFGGFDE